MKFTEQNTTDRTCYTYSGIFTKKEICELFIENNFEYEGIDLSRFIDKIMKLDDKKIIENFNKKMTSQIAIFAPGLFRFKYKNQ